MKSAGWLHLDMLLSPNVPVQPLQPIFMINLSGDLAPFNKTLMIHPLNGSLRLIDYHQ